MMEIVVYRLNLIYKNRNFERGRFSCQIKSYVLHKQVKPVDGLAYLSEAAESVVQV